MDQSNGMAVPADYVRAVEPEQRGTLQEVDYPVHHYINASRQLVTERPIDPEEAGRETVAGEAISKTCYVYLPAGYDEHDANNKYNVLYLLHGVGGDPHEWLYGSGEIDGRFVICNIADQLIARGEIEPLIIVFPNGRSAHDWTDKSFNAQGTNILGFYYFDYELRYDLIPFIESHYHTYANIELSASTSVEYNRLHRAIAGLSMGGMQCLNLVIGGERYDADMEQKSEWRNGLAPTVQAPGLLDLFGYVGAFSNAPTSSAGELLGKNIASSGHHLHLLYMTCGDEDGIAMMSYEKALNGLAEHAAHNLGQLQQWVIPGGKHDFAVWNKGAYDFMKLCFQEGKR